MRANLRRTETGIDLVVQRDAATTSMGRLNTDCGDGFIHHVLKLVLALEAIVIRFRAEDAHLIEKNFVLPGFIGVARVLMPMQGILWV